MINTNTILKLAGSVCLCLGCFYITACYDMCVYILHIGGILTWNTFIEMKCGVLFRVIPARWFFFCVEITSHLLPQCLMVLCDSASEYVHESICIVCVCLCACDMREPNCFWILIKWSFQCWAASIRAISGTDCILIFCQSAFPFSLSLRIFEHYLE